MTLGLAPRQADLFRSTAAFCEGRVAPDSIYGILHRKCFGLFPDEMFAGLFDDAGRRSVPPVIVAVVMVLQRIGTCRPASLTSPGHSLPVASLGPAPDPGGAPAGGDRQRSR